MPPERGPADDDLLSHLLFALKHEGVDLAILAESLPHLPVDPLVAALKASPNGIYLRRLAYLYEAFVGRLPIEPAVRGRVVPLFEPKHYVTSLSKRNSRWRVDFNGLARIFHRVSQKSPNARLGGDKRALGVEIGCFLINFLCSGRTSPYPHVFSVPGTARRGAIPAPACWPASGRGPVPGTGCSTSAESCACCG